MIRRLLLLVFIVMLTGCQSSQPGASDKTHISFWTLQMLSFKPYIEDLIAEYEASHPHIKIDWVDVPFSEGEKRAMTSMLSDTPPDIINLNPDFSALLAQRGALADVSTLISAQASSDYVPVVWESCKLNGQYFGLPWYITSAVTLYNAPLLRRAGWSRPPEHDGELAQAAGDVVSHHAGYLMMPVLTQNGRFFRELASRDIPVLSPDRSRFVFAESGAVELLTFYKDLLDRHLIPSDVVSESQQAVIDRYQSGQLGMMMSGPNFLKIVEENARPVFEATQVAPQYPARSQYKDFSAMVLVIPAKAAHPKDAAEFARFVTNTPNTLALSQLAPVLPPTQEGLTTILNSPVAANDKAGDKKQQATRLSAQQLLKAQRPLQVLPQQNRLNKLMDFYVQQALLGKRSPNDAMTRAQAEMNALLEAP